MDSPQASAFAIAAFDAHAADAALRNDIAADYRERLAALFDHFHRNPELSGLEVETSKRLAAEIRALGYEVTEGVGGHGVVAVMRNGAGPTVMLRADMDGLPVEEKSGLPNASTVRQVDITGIEQPVMHACGHDVHMTALVGTARQLAARKSAWSGTLVLIGQPAEERVGGARDMLADGLYTRFPKPDYALGFHVWSTVAAGTIMVPQTIAMSSADSVDVVVHGVGTHGASPHRGIDPVLVASQIVVSLQSLVSRSIDPLEAGIVTVGAIHGGTKHNIIGDRVDMQLTVRADNYETRASLLAGHHAHRARRGARAWRAGGQAARGHPVENGDDASDAQRRADRATHPSGAPRATGRRCRGAVPPRRHGRRGLRFLRRTGAWSESRVHVRRRYAGA